MVELILDAPPDTCFRQFCDPSLAKLWLPGLKQLRVVRTDERGRPLEVSFGFGQSLTYALVYRYDDAARAVRWVPSAGAQDGVSGFATFELHPGGCRFTYSVASQRGRAPLHAESVAQSFAEWIRSSPG